MGFWKKLKSAFRTVAKVALVVVAIVQPQLIPAIGNALGFTGAAATAAGAATITTASSLAQGNSLQDALKQGATAGLTSYIGINVATSTGSAATGAAAGSAVGTAAAGGSAQDVIRNAVAGGMGAGVGDATGSTSLGKGAGALVASGGNVNAAINAAVGTELTALAKQGTASYVSSATETLKNVISPPEKTPEQQAAADAQTMVDTSKAQPGTQLAQADTGTATDVAGTLDVVASTAPKYESGAPENVLPYTTTDVTKPSVSVPGQQPSGEIQVTAKRETPSVEDVLPFTSTDVTKTTSTPTVSQTPADTVPVAEKPTEQAPPKRLLDPSAYFYTGVAPTGGALAQGLGTTFSALPTSGLTGERGAGEIESKETGKARKNVWNEASLRLKDALGV